MNYRISHEAGQHSGGYLSIEVLNWSFWTICPIVHCENVENTTYLFCRVTAFWFQDSVAGQGIWFGTPLRITEFCVQFSVGGLLCMAGKLFQAWKLLTQRLEFLLPICHFSSQWLVASTECSLWNTLSRDYENSWNWELLLRTTNLYIQQGAGISVLVKRESLQVHETITHKDESVTLIESGSDFTSPWQ